MYPPEAVGTPPQEGSPTVHCVVGSLLPDGSSDPSLAFPSAAPWSVHVQGAPCSQTSQHASPPPPSRPESHALSCCEGCELGKALYSVCFSPEALTGRDLRGDCLHPFVLCLWLCDLGQVT